MKNFVQLNATDRLDSVTLNDIIGGKKLKHVIIKVCMVFPED